MIDSAKAILDWIGYVTTIIFLVTLIVGIYAWAKGILPALIRLGTGLSRRKIAIFAKDGHYRSLESLLLDSSLFSKKNLIDVTSDGDIGRAEPATVFLVYWQDWHNDITHILNAKKNHTALVIYAPPPDRIPDDKMKELNLKSNVFLANFRGRLLNDIVIAMMTTSYH